MKDSRPPKPLTRPEPRRVELVLRIYEPSNSALEESIALQQMSLEEAARRLMGPVEIQYIEEPWLDGMLLSTIPYNPQSRHTRTAAAARSG